MGKPRTDRVQETLTVFVVAEYAIPDQNLTYQNGVVIETWEKLYLILLALTSFLGAVAVNVNTDHPHIPF